MFISLFLGLRAFYLPGVAPKDYVPGDKVQLLVNALSADDSLIAYDYYYPEFHFCTPAGGPVAQRESLGSILFGDRLFSSPFEVALIDVGSSFGSRCLSKIVCDQCSSQGCEIYH